MRRPRFPFSAGTGVILFCWAIVHSVWAGGSGFNTVVVVNQASSNSRQLGNYFCERRSVPPGNLLRINWTGTNTAWSSNDFQNLLLTPLLDMLAARQLAGQVDYVVLSMDIPFQTVNGSTVNSTTSALFYGLRSNSGDPGVTNSYAGSEDIFAQAKPASARGSSFLATMITGESLADAMRLVDHGTASDATFPAEPVVLAKSSDTGRNIRYFAFDSAILNVRIRSASTILRTNSDSLWAGTNFLGYETGLANFNLPVDAFIPGAIADNLTSFGGVIFGPNTQTSLLAFLRSGAAGSYGTVSEPGTDPQKFPGPQVYFYQARGFTLAEAYYQGVTAPYLGLIVGEPLAAPFKQPASARWVDPPANSVLSGTASVSLRVLARDAEHAVQQIDLFVDGKYFNTLTNLTPAPGNMVEVSFNGYPVGYTVPSDATLASVAAGLASAINRSENTNATKILAFPHGDRIELRSLSTNLAAEPFYFPDTGQSGSGHFYRVSYLPNSFPPRLLPLPPDPSAPFRMLVEAPAPLLYVVQASTNLLSWVPVATNSTAGLFEFLDKDAASLPKRFYRVTTPAPDQPPVLSARLLANGTAFGLHIESGPAQPYAIQLSSNLTAWTAVFTNQLGGPTDFIETNLTPSTRRYYRAWLVTPPPPVFTVLDTSAGTSLVRIDEASRPYTVEVSTNQVQWLAMATNFIIGQPQITAVGSSRGSADLLSTFLTVPRAMFMESQAFGRQQFLFPKSSLGGNAYLKFVFTTTNGAVITVGLTNQVPGNSSTNFARQFFDLINATTALQGPDGVAAQDFMINSGATAYFNLLPRSPGWRAAGIHFLPVRSGISILPQAPGTLTENLSDLQPRNHLYLSAGLTNVNVNFPLDTTALPDGYHELTAVAYEGTHVHSQTHITLPFRITNSPLSATLALLDLANGAPAQGLYHLRVAVNTNVVSAIHLFGTGGLLNTISNQSLATFSVDGSYLGPGLHSFYALVETPAGPRYRTPVQWIRLTSAAN